MSVEDTIRTAISERQPVALCYDGGDRRTVHPHALYRTATGKTCLDGYQVEGPTSSGGTLPAWRPFNLAKVTDAELLTGGFDTAPGFDLAGKKYEQGSPLLIRD